MMNLRIAFVAALLVCSACIYSKKIGDAPSKELKLVWQDEFDYTGLPDSTKWGYDEGG